MKPTLVAIGLFAASAAVAGEGAWSNVSGPLIPGAGRIASVSAPEGGLQVFVDQASFDAAVGNVGVLAVETFDGGVTAAGAVNLCNEPMDSVSNDFCFAPGNLVGGFAITTTSGTGIVALGSGFLGLGQTSTVVGANSFPDSTKVAFTAPVTAFSMDLYDGAGAQPMTVEAFDAADVSLGTATATPPSTDAPVFLGVVSDTVVARIEITAANDSGELLDNLRFGDVSGPGDVIFQDGFEIPAPPVPPTVAKEFMPISIDTNANSQLVITLGNANATPATLSADLVDAFPQDLVVANPSDAATTCPSGTASAVAGGNSVRLTAGAQIPANGSCEVTVSVTSAIAGTYTNTIPAGALQTDLGNSTADAARDLTVTDPLVCNPVQLLQDSGFELTDNSAFPYTNPFWNGTSTNFGTPFCDEAGCGNGNGTALPHGGLFWAWLGGAGAMPETGTASQNVIIPAGQARFLNFWLWISAIGDASTNLDVSVDSTVVASIPEPAAAEAGYTQRSVDVSVFADGNSHAILFTYTSPGSSSSNFILDDVTLDCTPAPKTWPLPAIQPQTIATGRTSH
jgi:hypothetical protein